MSNENYFSSRKAKCHKIFSKKKMSLLDSLTKFADESSIHGLNYVAKSPSKTARIVWFILFTGALIYAGLQIGEEFRGKFFIPF